MTDKRLSSGARHWVSMTVNGRPVAGEAEPRTLLIDFLRHELALTGSHVGCEHGVCGACTVLIDGATARSCLAFAVQTDGAEVTTIEGLAQADGTLSVLQKAFRTHHGLQCGFCTPGFLISLTALFRVEPDASEARIREVLSGHLCRCTGYVSIVAAALAAQAALKAKAGDA